MNHQKYTACVDACMSCAATCYHCADIDLSENPMEGRCARLDIECATVCIAAGQLMSIGSDLSDDMCRLCANACRRCAEECDQHDNEHCRECAKACRRCAEECSKMAA